MRHHIKEMQTRVDQAKTTASGDVLVAVYETVITVLTTGAEVISDITTDLEIAINVLNLCMKPCVRQGERRGCIMPKGHDGDCGG